MVEIADGVAVIPAEGYDYRATLFNRRQIKAHGATWNKEAQQWQATDPATVEALRAWFAQSAPAADEQQEQAAEPATAPACYSDSEKSEISAIAANRLTSVDEPEPVAIAASYGSESETPDTAPANYSEAAKSEEPRRTCPLYNFSFKNRTAKQWTMLTVFDSEEEGEQWLQRAAKGVGALSVSACDFLDIQADYIIYFSRNSSDYICIYLADHTGNPRHRTIEELRGRLLDARKAAELKQIAQSIQEADRDGCAYEIHAGASVVRVDRDPRTPGHFRATWYVSGELDERRKAQTAEDAAGMVWLLRESCTLEGRQFQIKRPQAGYSTSAKSEPTAAPLTDCALLVSSDENNRKQFRQRHEEFYKLSAHWHGDEVNTNRETDLREHYDRESLAVHFLLSHELFYSWTDNRHREDCLDDVRQIYPDMTADELHDIRNKYAAAVGEIYG